MILENPNNFGNLSTEPYKPINILLLSDSGRHSKTKCTLLSWVLSCWVNYCLVQRTVNSNGSRMVMTVLCGSLVTRWMPPCLPHSLSPGSASGLTAQPDLFLAFPGAGVLWIPRNLGCAHVDTGQWNLSFAMEWKLIWFHCFHSFVKTLTLHTAL